MIVGVMIPEVWADVISLLMDMYYIFPGDACDDHLLVQGQCLQALKSSLGILSGRIALQCRRTSLAS